MLGSPIKLVGTASPEEFDQLGLEMKIKKITSKNFNGYEITSQKIVSYDYPSIGLLAELFNAQTREVKRIIVDAGYEDYVTLPQNKEVVGESTAIRSYYNEFSKTQIAENLAIWEKEESRIQKNLERMNSRKIFEKTNAYRYTVSKSVSHEESEDMKSVILSGLRYPTGVNILSPMSSTFQGYRGWCAVGAARAITDYYYMQGLIPSSRSLDTIATKMNVYGTTHGPTSDDEFHYYSDSWNQGGLGMSWGRAQRDPYFYEIKNSIDAGNPMKTNTATGHIYPDPNENPAPGHARACYGYDDRYTTKRVYYSDSQMPPAGNMYVEDHQPSLSFIYRT
jgi:hypothetical protein